MAAAGALSAQFGLIDETTFNTILAVTRFLEIVPGESVQQTIDRIESQGLRPARKVITADDWVAGKVSVGGDIPMEFMNKGMGLVLKHMMGTIASSQPNVGSNPTVWEHKATMGPLDGKSFGCQFGRAGNDGTVRAFSYNGCKVASWELDCDVDGILMLKLTVDGASESTAQALATASYAAGSTPLVWTGGVISVGGVATPIKKFSLKGDNGLKADRNFISATTPATKKEQLEATLRNYTGQLDVEFSDLTLYNKFVNGTAGALTAFFQGANISGTYNYALEVTLGNVRFDGQTPNIGSDVIEHSLPFKATDTSAGLADGPVAMVYRSTDTAP